MKFNTLTLTNGDLNFTVNLSNFTNNVEFLNFLIKNIKCAHYFLVGLGLFNLNYSQKYGNISDKNYQIKLASYNFKEDDKKNLLKKLLIKRVK